MKELMNQSPVVVFMKGVPDAPRCGFSRQTVGILRDEGVEFTSFDILTDEAVRQGRSLGFGTCSKHIMTLSMVTCRDEEAERLADVPSDHRQRAVVRWIGYSEREHRDWGIRGGQSRVVDGMS